MDSINRRVLVVDGHRTIRLNVSLAVQTLGYTLALAEDSRQAPDVRRAKPSDPVPLDIIMPVINSYQLPVEVKAGPNLRDFIVISAEQEMASMPKRIERGAEDLAPLTFDPVLPKTRVDTYLDRKWLRDQKLEYVRQVEHLTELRGVYPPKADSPAWASIWTSWNRAASPSTGRPSGSGALIRG